ncbi:MAG: 50S ribosomal protein L25 [Saprospiraceae bacterium]|nr:50S ribosomal protein L25 [Saprospiraceae bacterium]
MESIAVSGQPRTETGKKASNKDRANQNIPCVLYGGDEVQHFTTTFNQVKPLIYTPDFKLAEIELGGTKLKAIVKDVQWHPVTDEVIHIDFLRLVDGHPIKLQVPVRFKGSSPGVKLGGKLIQNLRRIKIKTTPEHMVGELFLDISKLELGHSIRVRDIEPNEGVEIMNPPATPVALVEIPRALRSAAAAEAKEAK